MRMFRPKFMSLMTVSPLRQEYENVGVKAKSRQEYCGVCSDLVYRTDRLDLGKFVLHEQCFRCLKCGLKLR